jgi:predicted MFS family arabinose efflux permease
VRAIPAPGTARAASPALTGARSRNLAAACLAVALLYVTIFVVPPLISPVFVDQLHESHADAGLLMTVYAAAYAGLSFPAGVLADRVGAQRMVAAGLALAGVASLVLPLDTAFGYLLFIRALTGVAAALVYAPGIALVRHAVPGERVHRAIGGFVAALTVGIATIYFLAPHLNAWIGWRWTFRVVGLACLAGLAALAALRPSVEMSATERGSLRLGVLVLLRDRALLAVAVSLTLAVFVLYGVLTWMPPFLSDVSRFSTATIGDVSVLIALSQIPAALLAGVASARLGRPVAVVGAGLAVSAIICLIGLMPAHDVAAVAAVAVASAFGGTVAVTVLFALPASTTKPALGGTATGVATTIGMTGAIGATYLGGVVVGDWSYGAWFALLAAVALGAVCLALPVTIAQMRRAVTGDQPSSEPERPAALSSAAT